MMLPLPVLIFERPDFKRMFEDAKQEELTVL